jgi:hypothetical protein
MKRCVTVFASLLFCSLGFGQGTLVPPEEFRHRPNFHWEGFYLESHIVKVTIKEGVAETRVEQVFVNPGRSQLEATYVFPVPAGANISRLTMTVGDKLMEAKIMPADEARRIYRDIVMHMRDPALLEYVGSRLVQLSIFPIPPGDKRKIVMTYHETLQREGGAYRYVYPFKLDGRSEKAPHLVSFSADIEIPARASGPTARTTRPPVGKSPTTTKWTISSFSSGRAATASASASCRTARSAKGTSCCSSRHGSTRRKRRFRRVWCSCSTAPAA